jgi:ABC-2 type transport system ATP-binding protein
VVTETEGGTQQSVAAGSRPSKAGDLVINLTGVRKVYPRKVHALRGVDMQVHAGEIFGLLGPNGAGKTTLVKIMMTAVRPTKASGTVLGRPVANKATLMRIGYLPENHRFPPHLTGWQTLMFYGAMAKSPRRERRRRAHELLEIVGMTEWASSRLRSYSKGMLQRVGLAQALVHDPDLVLLDEPTDGVDPLGRREIRDVLIRLRGEGKTIFLNSHLLSELEMICDRVAIMTQGQVAEQGTLEDLTRHSRAYEYVIAGAAPEWLTGGDDGAVVTMQNGASRIRIPGDEPEKAQVVIDRLRAEGVTIIEVMRKRESLEDLFLRAVKKTEGQVGADRSKRSKRRKGQH